MTDHPDSNLDKFGNKSVTVLSKAVLVPRVPTVNSESINTARSTCLNRTELSRVRQLKAVPVRHLRLVKDIDTLPVLDVVDTTAADDLAFPSLVSKQITEPGLLKRVWSCVAPEPLVDILHSDERIRFITRRHWLLPLQRVIKNLKWLPVMIALSYGLNMLAVWSDNNSIWWLSILLWLAPLGNLISAGYRVLLWMAERVLITDQRLILTSGVIHREIQQVKLYKIDTVNYHRSLCGRLFNYGTFDIGSASGEFSDVEYVPRPKRVYQNLKTSVTSV